jgi:HEAT repeat protein
VDAAGVNVDVSGQDLAEALGDLELPWLEPLVSSLGEQASREGDRGALELSIPGLPSGLRIRAPGVEIGDGGIRIEGAGGILRLRDRGATVKRYIKRLGHEKASVRKHAAWLLGTMRDPQAVPVLIKALEDPDALVRQEAAEALSVISGEDFGDDAAQWQAWWQQQQAGQPESAPAPSGGERPAEELLPPKISIPDEDN